MARPTRPTITVAMTVRDEAGHYLAEVLASATSWADRIVVLDDCSADDSASVARAAGAEVHCSERHEPSEPARRARLWDLAAPVSDYVFALDADEVLQAGWAAEVRDLAGYGAEIVALRFYDLWDSRATYRDDTLWCAHRAHHARMLRVRPGHPYRFAQRALHCGSLPLDRPPDGGWGAVSRAECGVLHLGWLRSDDRMRKATTYAGADPDGVWGSRAQYASILDAKPHLARLSERAAAAEGGPSHWRLLEAMARA